MNIFVAGFPESFSKKELSALFEGHGTVVSSKVISHRDTGVSRRFGFVEMSDEKEARVAIVDLHDKLIEQTRITVKEAIPKEK